MTSTPPHKIKKVRLVSNCDAMSTQVLIDSGGADSPESNPKDEPVSRGPKDELVPTLDTLPAELLLHIFSFIEAPFLISTVVKVCQKFFSILSPSSTYWKTRLTKWYHPCKYPPVPVDSGSFDWMNACRETEYTHNLWQEEDDKIEHLCLPFGLYKALHLFQDGNILAAGSWMGKITLFDLTRPEIRDRKLLRDAIIFSEYVTHKGPVSCISSYEKQFCSGSSDSNICLWDPCAEVPLVATYRCQSSVMDIHMGQQSIIAGGRDGCLYRIDRRTGQVRSTKIHHMPILCLAVTDRHIITGSEDAHICIYDRKAGTDFKRLKMENHPTCLSYADNQLWVGDRKGLVHLIDLSKDKFERIRTFDFGHKEELTCIKHSLGALFTLSSDQYIKVMEPTLDPKQIACCDPVPEELQENIVLVKLAVRRGIGCVSNWPGQLGHRLYRLHLCRNNGNSDFLLLN